MVSHLDRKNGPNWSEGMQDEHKQITALHYSGYGQILVPCQHTTQQYFVAYKSLLLTVHEDTTVAYYCETNNILRRYYRYHF